MIPSTTSGPEVMFLTIFSSVSSPASSVWSIISMSFSAKMVSLLDVVLV